MSTNDAERLLLLVYAFGGDNVPEFLFRLAHRTRREWGPDGYIKDNPLQNLNLDFDLMQLLTDDSRLDKALSQSSLQQHQHNNIRVWSLQPEVYKQLSTALHHGTWQFYTEAALRLLYFCCPPWLADSENWPKAHQLATWTLLDWLLRQGDSTLSHSGYVLEIILALAHRGTLEIRRGACVYAKELLKPQLPYYLGASVILAQSIVSRLSGNIEESDRWLDGWESQKLAPTNPRDHALDGRIKLSGLENMLQRQDWRNEAAVWSWEPGVHPSPLEADTQRRRLQAMARVFQSIGRFDMARESLEESLKLTSVPARDTHVIMSRLADMHCELGSFDHAEALAKAEIAKLGAVPRPSRLLWRLKLALIEAKIGQGDLASATEHLGTLAAIDLYQPADIVDELLQVRALMAKARVSHLALHYSEAIHDWENVLGSTRRFASFKHGQGFTTAIVYLSLTHALLMIRNSQDAKLRLASANAILETEKVDYWIPRAATDWFPKMSTEIQKQTGMVVYRLSSNPSPAFNLLL